MNTSNEDGKPSGSSENQPTSKCGPGFGCITVTKTGKKCGLFTLKPSWCDYDQVADQMSVPGVLAMVKGVVSAASLPCNPGIFFIIGASLPMSHILWGHGSRGSIWCGIQPAAWHHSVRRVVWEGVHQTEKSGGRDPGHRGCDACCRGILSIGHVLNGEIETTHTKETHHSL